MSVSHLAPPAAETWVRISIIGENEKTYTETAVTTHGTIDLVKDSGLEVEFHARYRASRRQGPRRLYLQNRAVSLQPDSFVASIT